MTVKDLKKRLENLDDDQMVIITDGEGWCNIEKIEVKWLINNTYQVEQNGNCVY